MVMPLWDENPFTKSEKPWATWGIIGLNIVVFALQAAFGEQEEAILKAYALTPVAVSHPVSLLGGIPADLTLVTSMFLHADIFHLFGNMIFLFVFGDDVEEAMGSLRFIVFYLSSGIVGALAFVASGPQSVIPLIGASGAVSGVIAAYLMLRPCAKIKVLLFYFVFSLDAFWVIGSWALLQLVHLASQPDDDVAYWAHIGGLLAGALLFPIMRRPGVDLFECVGRREDPFGGEPVANATTLSGVPREPTVR
jgi:membrane associated rhomboid family serine protease